MNWLRKIEFFRFEESDISRRHDKVNKCNKDYEKCKQLNVKKKNFLIFVSNRCLDENTGCKRFIHTH